MARILLADDDEDVRALIEFLLLREGHLVQTVADGPAALATFQPGLFDLICLDLDMPLLNGIEVARAVRQSPGGSVPILMVTGSAWDQDLTDARDAGINALLTKPFLTQHLRAHVSDLLSQAPPPNPDQPGN